MELQHAGLSLERWRSFSLSQQILMIANEMNRAKKLFSPLDIDGLRKSLERILYLTDLTILVCISSTLRKELLRLRDLVADQYLLKTIDLPYYKKIFKCLLLLNTESAKQIPFLLTD